MPPQSRVLDSERAIELHERFTTLRAEARTVEPESWWLKATELTSLGYEAIVVEIAERLERYPSGKAAELLDWGAGPGFLTYLLEAEGIATTYYDFERDWPSYVHVIDQLKGRKVFVGEDPTRLPFEDDSFDAATSCGVLEHVPDATGSLHELHRVLKPGGLLFIHHFPNHWSWTERLADRIGQDAHDVRWTKAQMERNLNEAGFEVESFDYRYLVPRNLVNYPKLNRFISAHARGIYDIDRFAARVPLVNRACNALNCTAVKR